MEAVEDPIALEIRNLDRGLDLSDIGVRRKASGFHVRVVQHECDHLDGILYPERMTDLKFLVYEGEMDAFMAGLNS